MCQAWVHLSNMRVGGCAYHLPGMGAFERHALLTMCQAWLYLSDTRVGGCAYHVPGMGASKWQAWRTSKNVTSKATQNVQKERLRGPNAELRCVARVAGVRDCLECDIKSDAPAGGG